MKVPYSWLREYCAPDLTPEELAELIALRTTEVERISRVGPPRADGFVVGRVASVAPHPNADRLSVCEVETGEGKRTIVCGAPNVAEGQTVPVALPGAIMPDGQELGRAELRGVTSDGMILSEAELQISDDGRGNRGPGAAVGGGHAARRGAADRRAGARAGGRIEPGRLPGRVWGGAGGSRLQRGPVGRPPVGAGRRGDGERRGLRLRVGLGRGPRAVSAVHGPRVHGGDGRPVSVVAEGATRGRRSAADQQPRRHHQLRDAAHGAALACVRPRPGARRRLDRAHGGRRGADDDPGRSRAQVRCRLGPGLRSRRAVGSRRDHGWRGVGGLRFDHPRAARGRDLERGQHPAHLAQARIALRGLEQVREAASPRAGDQRPAGCVEPDRRAVWSEARPGDDRRGRGDARGAPRSAARRAGRGAARHADRTGALRRVPVQVGFRGRARRRRADGRGARPPLLRRQPRGRPGGGGGADSRLRASTSPQPCRGLGPRAAG